MVGVTQDWNVAGKHISTVKHGQQLFKTTQVMFTFQNQHQGCNSGFDVLFEHKAEWKKESASPSYQK